MKTKIIALMLALVMIVGMMASCQFIGGGTTDDTTTPDDGDDTTGGGNKPGPGTGNTNTSSRPWEETTLIFEMTDNSNNSELGSTCRRYLAGDMSKTNDTTHTVDTLVTARNAKAYADANVKVQYTYNADTAKYQWGANIDRISEQVASAAASAPDIYCNFVYDIVACSLKGSFANLLSTTMYKDGHALAGAEHNYFAFEDEIDIEDDGVNYMTDYMRSLTLSKYKMYCLSSDYFTDMVRAFFVVPVNIQLLESIQVATEDGQFNSDRAKADGTEGKDGEFTVEDFYQLIWDGEWTYETLAAYSTAVSVDTNTADGSGYDIGDTLGFALATSSGLSASGMLYTTSITIIDRQLDTAKGDYTYSYPGTEPAVNGGYQMAQGGEHKELEAFCDALTALFSNTAGVIAIDNLAGQAYGPDALQAIRNRFAVDKILFGGVICLGSLEDDVYKGMNVDGKKGYGVAPVPLYREGYTNAQGEFVRDEYLTQIHNVGRIGAISYTTQKFAQCTAFLDYQCMNSNEILNTYYDYKLQYDVVNSDVQGNVEMLKYIRYHVRSSFDKAYEDALGIFYSEATDGESSAQIWHYIIKGGNFKVSGADIGNSYASFAPVKAQRLYDLENSTFPALPK